MNYVSCLVISVALIGWSGSRGNPETNKPSAHIPFVFDGIKKWSIKDGPEDDGNKTFIVKNTGGIEFTVNANLEDNSLIMCFCAPLSEYKIEKHVEYTTNQWPNPDVNDEFDGIFTMKYQGKSMSLDVHYMYDDNNESWPTVKAALISLRPLEYAAQHVIDPELTSPNR